MTPATGESFKFEFRWKCPKCGHKHSWCWDYFEVPRVSDIIFMICDECGKKSEMKAKLVPV